MPAWAIHFDGHPYKTETARFASLYVKQKLSEIAGHSSQFVIKIDGLEVSPGT
ncbi:hypothetical protein CLAFUW4_12159 [Fulvia fulva]|uniref:uncharacterized protein n=1 Tax=Passalora fulva TaxID=5499 RepID=UPI0004E9F706|nr:uncharacterized protein CLAFUR5_20328 [Fulvia fulva]KAK4617475.1 hypothetical protein CLAFUR4_12164 [Fulvia fulva]KAK4618609.1 hypothetical protein CLAFUR0_12175 [Fulvia fulva]WMI38979.1 hypothetical protein CLAFUR5_20328 [Fulvia fulva]WPV17807.1 hypothetical protein CLAFUW4_12159 [Fulvia fulva]WPV33420.1 hypothetical protein CLAFUW7_12166 [Fulvia fulva]